MKSALGSFIVLPLLGIALVAALVGFRPLYLIVASVVGEVAGLFLYSAYNKWKVSGVLSGLESGTLTYRGVAGPRNILAGLTMFAAIGVAITGCVLIGYGIYRLARTSSVISRLIVLLAPLGLVACGARIHSPATDGTTADSAHQHRPTPVHSLVVAGDSARATSSGVSARIRSLLDTTTITLERLEVHQTTLAPGGSPHPPHRHAHEEMMLV